MDLSLLFIGLLSLINPPKFAIDYTKCTKDNICFGHRKTPQMEKGLEDCSVETHDCTAMVILTLVRPTNSTPGHLEHEMYLKTEGEEYVSFALSEDEYMGGNDLVVDCFLNGSKAQIRESVNYFHDPLYTEDGEIKSDSLMGITKKGEPIYENGLLKCAWTREAKSQVRIGQNTYSIDLTEKSYYPMMSYWEHRNYRRRVFELRRPISTAVLTEPVDLKKATATTTAPNIRFRNHPNRLTARFPYWLVTGPPRKPKELGTGSDISEYKANMVKSKTGQRGSTIRSSAIGGKTPIRGGPSRVTQSIP